MMMLQDEPCHALALAGQELVGALEAFASDFEMRLDVHEDDRAFLDAIARDGPDLVVVDSDIMGHPCDLSDLVRNHNPQASFIVVAWFWSDREEALRDCADAVVHKPIRGSEWRRAFADCGVRTRVRTARRASG